jgi:hypothetical protein
VQSWEIEKAGLGWGLPSRSPRLKPWQLTLLVLVSLLVLAIVAILLVGVHALHSNSAEGQAADAVQNEAFEVSNILADRLNQGSATDLARAVDQSMGDVVLAARGEVRHGGAHVLVRLSATRETSGAFSEDETATVTRCFLYDVVMYYAPVADEVGCPNESPLFIPSPPTLGDLTQNVPAAISALPAPEQLEPTLVRSVVASTVRVPQAKITATEVDGTVGVAVSLSDPLQCVLIRVNPRIELWYPPAVLSQPGEDGCTAYDAAMGLEMAPPH